MGPVPERPSPPRLGADHSTDLVAVDIEIANPGAGAHLLHRGFNAGVEAEGEAVTGGIEGGADISNAVAGKAHHMQDGAEDFALQRRQGSS